MKSSLYPKLSAIVFVTVLLIFLNSCNNNPSLTSSTNSMAFDTTARNNYMKLCADCHGPNLEKFRNKRKLYGKDKSTLYNSIALGLDDGMPGFKDGLSEQEINELVDFLLLEITKEFEAQRHKFPEIISSEKQNFTLETVVDGLKIPWGMEFLPNGEMLIAEREGILYLLSKNKELKTIEGLPQILVNGQGGLMDIEIHPDYASNGWIYFSYSKPSVNDSKSGNTAVFRAKLENNQLVEQEEIFKAIPDTRKGHHWGSKLEFDNDGYLFLSVGDRGNRDRNPQTLDNSCGKIHRIYDDGRIPEDNPFYGQEGAIKSIFSYGHRNPQGVAINPETGDIWTHEHGPKGGDEINISEAGKNYGWPIISFGINYSGTKFTEDTAKAGMEQPLLYWVPSIAPCGMTFVKGDQYSGWKNSLLVGSLKFQYLKRCEVIDGKVVQQENLLEGIGRVRNVEMSPDGYIYIAVEMPGIIYRLVPVE